MAQLVSACVWGAQGRWFESSLPDIKNPAEDFLPDSFVYLMVKLVEPKRIIIFAMDWQVQSDGLGCPRSEKG